MVVSIQEPEYKNTLLTVLKNDLPAIIPSDTIYGFVGRIGKSKDIIRKIKSTCVIPASLLT